MSITVSTLEAETGHATIRIYGGATWDHNEKCRARWEDPKLRSPEALAFLKRLVAENTGKTNADIMREYRQEIAKQEMAKMNMTTFEELNLYFNEHPDKIPRDYVITRKVRPRC